MNFRAHSRLQTANSRLISVTEIASIILQNADEVDLFINSPHNVFNGRTVKKAVKASQENFETAVELLMEIRRKKEEYI